MRGSGLLLAWWAVLAAPAFSQDVPSALQPQGTAESSKPGVHHPAASAPALKATPQGQELSEKEKALLEKINALKAPRWRSFGPCRYDWSGWKLMGDGVRTTGVQCGPDTSTAASEAAVAVHCDTLKLSIRTGAQPWSAWRLPYATAESKERGGEDRMVASLCANAKPIPKPEPSEAKPPTPAGKSSGKPAVQR